jgi:hypothetical protein
VYEEEEEEEEEREREVCVREVIRAGLYFLGRLV